MTEENLNNNPEAAAASPPGTEELQKRLSEEQVKAERYLSNWQRAQADFENYQKRTERDRCDISDSARNSVLMGILPVADDFELAMKVMPKEVPAEWANGIKMIERKLRGFLDNLGVFAIETVGKPFDPKYHEAVMKADGEEGTVVQELRKGYIIRDCVLRPSLVAVGNGNKPEPVKSEPRKAEKTANKERHTGTKKEEHDA